VPGGTLDLDRLHWTGEDPRAGPSHQAQEQIPIPRVRFPQRPPFPSLASPAYWSMEPSDPATSLRSRREPPCAIHGLGPCPYPVAPRQTVLSSPSLREGEREGEEGLIDVEDVVEVIPVPESPPRRLTYKQTTWIRIDPWGRPTRPLVPRTSAREADQGSPETGSTVWPLPPPPPSSGASSTTPPL
jgi:hypothetical protein